MTDDEPEIRVEDAAWLGLAALPAEPPPALKTRLLEKIASAGTPRSSAAGGPILLRPGVSLLHTEEQPWREYPFPGVRYKRVHTGKSAETYVIEMAPGSSYPDHHHDRLEEIFVLRGSLSVAGNLLRTGDYCRSEPGTHDWGIVSEEGALFLVSLSAPPAATVR